VKRWIVKGGGLVGRDIWKERLKKAEVIGGKRGVHCVGVGDSKGGGLVHSYLSADLGDGALTSNLPLFQSLRRKVRISWSVSKTNILGLFRKWEGSFITKLGMVDWKGKKLA